jgi:streptogramin lyase/signal transduction histidine kinase
MALDRKSGRAASYRKTGGPGELSDTWVYSVAEDRSGYLWFGTLNGGLNRFDRRSGQFKAYRRDPADPRSLSDNRVLRLFIDHKGALWAGTEKGLSVFDAAAGTFQTYLKDKRVRDIAEDAHGVLWIAARAAGLVRLDPAEKQETTYRLSSDKAWSVTVDRTGIVWVGTESGLNRFDPATQTSTAYYESDGLPDNSISHILEDERGDLWVSTHNGLSRFNPRAKTFQNYYVSDGLSGNEFYDNSSSFRSPSGEMFLSANGGLTAFFPRDIVDDQRVAPVVITSFKVFGKESPLKPVLSHSQNVVTFEFSTLSFTSPERNRYRYRLEPVEKEWNESQGDRRSITYALSPGDYTFRVQGSNSRDLWNEQGASVRFGIAKPWWNSWPFRTGVIVLVLLSLGYGYYLHLQKIRWEFSVRLDERVGERTRIARELHDTLLQSFQGALYEFQAGRNLLARGREEAVHTIDSAINNAQGAIAEGRAAIEDLRGTVSGQTRLEDLLKIAGTELASSQVSNGSGPVFRVIVEGRPQALAPVLHDDVHQIAREVIRNSFRHANASRIETEIRYDVSQFRVRVRDDGKGIDPKVLEVGMRPGHWGLPGSRERAKRIGARLTFWSEAGAGTEVELTIPARIAYAKRQ